jgi:hypothetical protein
MDTFMANMPSGGEIAPKENTSIIVAVSMLSIAAYNDLETVLIRHCVQKTIAYDTRTRGIHRTIQCHSVSTVAPHLSR